MKLSNPLERKWHLREEVKEVLEEYVCQLYSSRHTQINDARYGIFVKKHTIKDTLIDLSILPPCKSSLMLHIERANYVARIWKTASTSMVRPPEVSEHGWSNSAEIQWIDESYPTDITTLLLRDTDDIGEEYGEEENDDECDDESED